MPRSTTSPENRRHPRVNGFPPGCQVEKLLARARLRGTALRGARLAARLRTRPLGRGRGTLRLRLLVRSDGDDDPVAFVVRLGIDADLSPLRDLVVVGIDAFSDPHFHLAVV